MLDQDPYRVETPTQVPATVGVGKAVDETEVLGDVHKYIAKLEKQVRAGLITEEQARDKLAKKTAKKYAESLQKQVQKGITSRDEVLRALGLPVPSEEMAAAQNYVAKTVSEPVPVPEPEVSKGLTPEVMKTMMSEILQPFEERIAAQDKRIEDLLAENSNYRQKAEELQGKVQVYDQRWDALASQADPSTAAFTGLAFNPVVRNAPAGITKTAEANKSVQSMMMRQLERTWRTSENPAEREAAYAALLKYQGNND
jgi:predicted ribosome quality control (RQC) complex YloA/Tae2 family protein